MKSYISDIIPKIKRFSQKLDNLTLLTNQHWVILDDINNSKKVLIFRNNGELLISINGNVTRGKWEFLGNNNLLIDQNNTSFLYKHGFFDANILALKIDGVNEFSFLINENKYEGELNSLENITHFLEEKYLNSNKIGKIDKQNSTELDLSSNNIHSEGYKIISEEKRWSFSTGKYVEYMFEFNNARYKALYDSKRNKFCYSTYDTVECFNDLNECILSYIKYIKNNLR